MAGELQIGGLTTGWAAYAVVRSATGTVWNGTAFEAFNAANWATYDIALTEQGSTGYYVGTFPTVAAGVYAVEVRRQTGGSPAAAVATDPYLGGGDAEWDGTVLRGAGNVNLAAWAGSAPAALNGDNYLQVSVRQVGGENATASAAVDFSLIGTVTTDGITAASLATGAITAASLAADAVAEIQGGLSTLTAAGLLAHEVGSGRTVSYYLMGGFNKTVRTGTTFTVYSHDDTTPLASAALTENGDREPVESIDP
jgi:hypothetical protein